MNSLTRIPIPDQSAAGWADPHLDPQRFIARLGHLIPEAEIQFITYMSSHEIWFATIITGMSERAREPRTATRTLKIRRVRRAHRVITASRRERSSHGRINRAASHTVAV